MSNASKALQVRLNPKAYELLESLIEAVSDNPQLLSQMIAVDKKERDGYRGFNGRKPTAQTMVLRRALTLGLAQLKSEILK